MQGLKEYKVTGYNTHQTNAPKVLALLLPLLADPSRRVPVRAAVNPQRLTLLGESHLEHYLPW